MSAGKATSDSAGHELLQEDVEDLYEQAPCGYLSTAADGTIVKVNGTFLSWTGLARGALIGRRRFLDLLTRGGQVFYETHMAPLLRMQGFVREIALEVVRADDAPMPVLVNASRRVDPDGTADIVRITLFDATERRRYERELMLARRKAEEAAQSRARLVSTISHDLRAPLSAILTAGALLEKSSPTERQMRFIRVIRTSSDQALALVNTVLELGRLEAGHATLRERDFDLGQLVRDVAEGSRLMAERKPDLALHVNIDDRLPATLVGDPDKITQILVNLTSNAVKFTEHGTVSLVVSVRDLEPATATVQVLVSDTGIGIPADRLSHIFEEYTQASRDIGEQFGGTGLGLAIARRLLLLYGSELRVTSTVGEGTTFSFELVLKRAGTTSLGEAGG